MATVALERLVKRYGPIEAVRAIDLEIADRRIRRPGRPFGLRQVDDAADDRRARGDFRRRDPDRRRDRQRSAAALAQHLDGVPVLCALSAYERAREHGLLAEDRQAPAGRDRHARRRGERDPASRRAARPASPRSSPAASASASPWAARSCASPRCSCSTSRSPISTPSCARRCAPRSSSCMRACPRPSSTSRTTRSRR